MSILQKLKQKRIHKAERMQSFAIQAEWNTTILAVTILERNEERTNFLVVYANNEKREEMVENDSPRFLELSMYIYD